MGVSGRVGGGSEGCVCRCLAGCAWVCLTSCPRLEEEEQPNQRSGLAGDWCLSLDAERAGIRLRGGRGGRGRAGCRR